MDEPLKCDVWEERKHTVRATQTLPVLKIYMQLRDYIELRLPESNENGFEIKFALMNERIHLGIVALCPVLPLLVNFEC